MHSSLNFDIKLLEEVVKVHIIQLHHFVDNKKDNCKWYHLYVIFVSPLASVEDN